MKLRILFWILLMEIPVVVLSQSDTLYISYMQEVYKQNYWLYGNNPIGLSFNNFKSFSIAEAGFNYSNGNLGRASLPTSTSVYSVQSESFQRTGQIALYGKIAYEMNRNHGQNWNGMTNDYWHTLNLCDSVPGKRSSETYNLAGAFSLPVKSHWLLGAKLNYNAQITTKDTNPRNKNQWSGWVFTSGVAYHDRNYKFGLSLLYADRKESVDFQNMGTHVVYPLFISYPLNFYKSLPKDDNIAWHYTGREFNGALQLDISLGALKWFQQFEGSLSKQNIESNRIQNRKEGESGLWQLNYLGKIQRLVSHYRHEWGIRVKYKQTDNYDPLQQQLESGVWKSYGRVLRSTCRVGLLNLSYEFSHLRDAWNPRFTVSSGISYGYLENVLLFYPTEYVQPLHRLVIYTMFMRSFTLPNASLDCSLNGKYKIGGGTMLKEKSLTSDSSTGEIKLWQNTDCLQQDYDYETATYFSLNFSVTYMRKVPFYWFVRVSGGYGYLSKCQPNENSKKIVAQIGLIF